ncbi:MAG: peptide chain release factor N(5)-glutamine methyltransferase [Pseudomonadota bacterium]
MSGLDRLRAAGVETPAHDARRLLAHAAGLGSGRLTLCLGDEVGPDVEDRFAAAISARCARQPVAQIIGQRLFFGRPFKVTSDVLDPRPETEILVLAALEEAVRRVLDLGTGSGCILATLLSERTSSLGTGVDVSEAALNVARINCAALGVVDRAALFVSDWFDAVDGIFDLIVSNPPYVSEREYPRLSPDVRQWEPALALTPGGDGLGPYHVIAAQAARFLEPDGRLIVEIAPWQGGAVSRLFEDAGLTAVRVRTDLDGRDRIVEARRSVPAE